MLRRVGIFGALAAVALIALIVILKGFHPSGVITLGDAIVGIGTLTLAVLTGALAVATARVDRNVADRDERRRRRELRGIARLIDAQLEIVQRSWETADGAGIWRLSLQTPHGAWDAYATIILQDVCESDGLTLVQFFLQLASWETEVAIRADNPLEPTMSVAEDSPWRKQFLALQRPLSSAGAFFVPRPMTD